jgi:hypothetical protein
VALSGTLTQDILNKNFTLREPHQISIYAVLESGYMIGPIGGLASSVRREFQSSTEVPDSRKCVIRFVREWRRTITHGIERGILPGIDRVTSVDKQEI